MTKNLRNIKTNLVNKITKIIKVRKPGTAGSVTMPLTRAGNRKRQLATAKKQVIVKQVKTNQNQSQTDNTNNTKSASNLEYDNSKILSNEIEGEKYLIVHRTDHGLTMKDMSPIMLETAFKTVTNNGKITCRTLKSGDILVKTENIKQAKSLIALTRITQAHIEVTEHRTLNSSRGVVSAYELKYEDGESLLEYLKSQQVTKIDFHMKNVGNERIKSGLVFVTFGINEPPEYLTIGCLKLKVRPYIPAPMRCFTCHKFGHISKGCPNQNAPKCYNCCEDKHIQTRDEKCAKPQKCMNCGSNEHNSYNRSCPELKRQIEIQTIKVTQKVSFSEAVKRSNLQRKTYAQITANNSTTTPMNASVQCQCPHCSYHKTQNSTQITEQRKIIDYGDLNEKDQELEEMENLTSQTMITESSTDKSEVTQDGQHTNNSQLEY